MIDRCRIEAGYIGESFLLILRQQDVAGETEHIKQFNCLVIDVGEDNLGTVFFGDVNDSEENGDAYTVNELSVAEIYDQSTTA